MHVGCNLTEKDSMSASASALRAGRETHATPESQIGATHHFSELVTPQVQALQLYELMYAPADIHIHSITNIINRNSAWYTNISEPLSVLQDWLNCRWRA